MIRSDYEKCADSSWDWRWSLNAVIEIFSRKGNTDNFMGYSGAIYRMKNGSFMEKFIYAMLMYRVMQAQASRSVENSLSFYWHRQMSHSEFFTSKNWNIYTWIICVSWENQITVNAEDAKATFPRKKFFFPSLFFIHYHEVNLQFFGKIVW